MTATQTHFFGSTFSNWATAPTREAVIAKLAKQLNARDVALAVKQLGGVFVWTCEVQAPERSNYGIDNFKPTGVAYREPQSARITSVRGATAPAD